MTKTPSGRWNAIRREGLLRVVFYRGFLQFGLLSWVLFIIASAVQGDTNFTDHSLRALIAFPLAGIPFGFALWLTIRLSGTSQ